MEQNKILVGEAMCHTDVLYVKLQICFVCLLLLRSKIILIGYLLQTYKETEFNNQVEFIPSPLINAVACLIYFKEWQLRQAKSHT